MFFVAPVYGIKLLVSMAKLGNWILEIVEPSTYKLISGSGPPAPTEAYTFIINLSDVLAVIADIGKSVLYSAWIPLIVLVLSDVPNNVSVPPLVLLYNLKYDWVGFGLEFVTAAWICKLTIPLGKKSYPVPPLSVANVIKSVPSVTPRFVIVCKVPVCGVETACKYVEISDAVFVKK